jgi:beta-phosphoglucomutase-like phosphatase (HAD superfamily)
VRAFLERLQSTQARALACCRAASLLTIFSRCSYASLSLCSRQVPCAIGCSESAASVERGLAATGLRPYFEAGAPRGLHTRKRLPKRTALQTLTHTLSLLRFAPLRSAPRRAVITGDDVQRGRPDPECYLYSAQAIKRPPARCIVIGNANACVEAAQEGGMKAVAVANRHALYELSAADLVVRQLDELSIVNLKKLFATEAAPEQPQTQTEAEDDAGGSDDDDGDDDMFGSRLF